MHYFKGILNFLCIYSNFNAFYPTNIYNVIDAEHEIIIIFSHKLRFEVNFNLATYMNNDIIVYEM